MQSKYGAAKCSSRRGEAHLRTGAAVVTVSPRAVVVPARQRAEAVGVGVAVTFPDIAQVDRGAAVVVADARVRMIIIANLKRVSTRQGPAAHQE